MKYLTLKELGIRRLNGNDIIRDGDLQWCDKMPHFESVNDLQLMVVTRTPAWQIGCQVCTEEIQNYANKFFRRLTNVTNQAKT